VSPPGALNAKMINAKCLMRNDSAAFAEKGLRLRLASWTNRLSQGFGQGSTHTLEKQLFHRAASNP
jgi:hypothetical protein